MNVLDRLVVLSQPLTNADGDEKDFVPWQPEWEWVPRLPAGRWRSVVLKRIVVASAALSTSHLRRRLMRSAMAAIRLNTEEATWFRTVPR